MVKKTAFHMLILLICSVALGYFMLVLVYCIPQGRLKGLGNSVAAIRKDDEDLSEVIFGYPGSRLDVFTDGAMLNTASHTNDEGPLRRAIACHQYSYKDRSPAQAFIDFYSGIEPDGEVTYVRYWHGFLVVLKPLLLFFGYSDIRILNHMGQLLIVFLTLYALVKKGLSRYVPAVLMTYFFLTPIVLPMAMQYSACFYTGFGSLACILLFYDRIKDDDRLFLLFMLTGILTSYTDLLTYPVFTLGLPLLGLLILMGNDGSDTTFAGAFIKFMFCGISWFLGYALMWIGKVLISIPFYGLSVISDTAGSVASRSASGASSEGYTYLQALHDNLFMYKNDIYRISLILYTVAVAVYFIYGRCKGRNRIDLKFIPMYLCVTAIPFVWYMVTIEHACVHAFMTYKDLTVAVFAYCVAVMSVFGSADKESIKRKDFDKDG
ncbi:MAG: hypothetical protein IKX95_00715 [Lachnospiraceae bacterium]|nr:hypothetical protein [Lachnospiraceae bacterium]MBR5765279.1 hypothetical protein [Lachnospiraceae bacterium]MBR6485240.1 hypothetical protein [Lachnospiraceae bacterium]